MDSLSNLITILQTNQKHKNSVAIVPYSKFSESFLTVLHSENLINGYAIKYTLANTLSFSSKQSNQTVTIISDISKKLEKSGEMLPIKNENFQLKKRSILVYLKYEKGVPGLQQCLRISKPGRRFYCNIEFLKKKTKGFHILLLSTTSGIKSHREAKTLGIGGEVLCKILL